MFRLAAPRAPGSLTLLVPTRDRSRAGGMAIPSDVDPAARIFNAQARKGLRRPEAVACLRDKPREAQPFLRRRTCFASPKDSPQRHRGTEMSARRSAVDGSPREAQ